MKLETVAIAKLVEQFPKHTKLSKVKKFLESSPFITVEDVDCYSYQPSGGKARYWFGIPGNSPVIIFRHSPGSLNATMIICSVENKLINYYTGTIHSAIIKRKKYGKVEWLRC